MRNRIVPVLLTGLFVVTWFSPVVAWSLPARLSGKGVMDSQPVTVDSKGKKGLVAVFLSAKCPCSVSHVPAISALAREFSDYAFVGIHSNDDEDKESTIAYFKNANLPFPVLRDTGARIADDFKAMRTPHAFIVLSDGAVAFQGGVSDSSDFPSASRNFLREALISLRAGQKVKMAQARPLGCAIPRGEKSVW